MKRPLLTRTSKLSTAFLAASAAGLALASSAWAPPAPGVPNVVVAERCVEYGHGTQVGGGGLPPEPPSR